MSDLLGILGALAVFVLPLLLAWRLLGREPRVRTRRKPDTTHEKMPR